MVKVGEYSDYDILNAINDTLNNSALDDDEIEKYTDGIFAVITSKVQARTAADKHRLDLKQLNALINLAKKNLEGNNKAKQKEDNASDVNENEEHGKMNDKNLEQETEGEEEMEDERKNQQKSRKNAKGTLKNANEEKGTKQKGSKKNNKQEKISKKEAVVEPEKPARKKRRNNEEFMIEEAHLNVFKGKDPDNQALSLALESTFNEKAKADHEEEQEQKPSPRATRSRRSLANATLQQKPSYMSASQLSSPVASNSKSSHQNGSTSVSSNQSSLALVPFLPKASKGSISLAKPDKKEGTSQKQANSAANRCLIKFNLRWTEYPKLTEDIVDEVMMGMQLRKQNDEVRKEKIRAAILDVILVQFTIAKAATDNGVGQSTIRRYCKDVKIRLDEYLGEDVADEQFLLQFQNYKADVSLAHFREALKRAKKEAPPEFVTTKQTRKRPAPRNSAIMETPKKSNSTANDSTSSLPAKRPRYSNSAGNAQMTSGSGQKTSGKLGPNSPTKNVASGSVGTSTSSGGNTAGKENNNVGKQIPGTVANISQTGGTLLLTSQQRERKPIRGTPAQIRQMIYDFFMDGRYEGDVNLLSNYLMDILVSDARLKRYNEECPIQILYSGYNLFGRFFQVENVQLEDDEQRN